MITAKEARRISDSSQGFEERELASQQRRILYDAEEFIRSQARQGKTETYISSAWLTSGFYVPERHIGAIVSELRASGYSVKRRWWTDRTEVSW